ncbi:centrosomal protein of 78 kDa-like [Symsagittifera roscoffensis]|uniref:centrosomal protein of 78 kDa-like n=1 Tax=Symsagittifera roscoffensis TaxID=84072 RepID=UPI00307C35BD
MPLASSGSANHVNSNTFGSSGKDNPQYESVQVRQRGAWDFASYYESLCVLQDSCPLQAVKANLNVNTLDINADRVREEDWEPIFNSIKINKSLEFIAVRSYYDPEPEDMPTPRYPILKSSRKAPSIRKKELISKLSRALKQCLKVTGNLKVLELQGLPLSFKDVEEISAGLHENDTLTKLSLEFCDIGNDSVEVLCLGLKHALCVSFLDLTCCNLSSVGANALAKLVVYQSSLRHAEAWQDSLRYRRPNLDMLLGLRRIVLNGNSLIGDEGAACFADALRDDLWLKALDLQKCGLTNDGAKALLEVLKFSVTMVVCDIRKNPFVDKELIRSVTEQCLINCQGRDVEYPWLKMKSSENPDILKLKMKTFSSATNTPRSSRGSGASSRKAKKAKSDLKSQTAREESQKRAKIPVSSGYPWRTAMRVNRHKTLASEHDLMASEKNASERENQHQIRRGQSSSQVVSHYGPGAVELSYDDEDFTMTGIQPNGYGAPRVDHHSRSNDLETKRPSTARPNLGSEMSSDMRLVMVELEKMKMKLDRETDARRRCDQRLIDLEIENSRLRREVLSAKSGGATAGNLSEEQSVILDSVEETFKKFSKFLDLLRQAGFGDLADLAGLDTEDLEKMSQTRPGKKPTLQKLDSVDSGTADDYTLNNRNFSKTSQFGGQGDAQRNNLMEMPKSEGKKTAISSKSREEGGSKYYAKTSEELMQEIRSMTNEQSENDFTAAEKSHRQSKREDMNVEDILDDEDEDESHFRNNSEMDQRTPSPLPISIVTDNEGSRYD